jgi:hypothetical protein
VGPGDGETGGTGDPRRPRGGHSGDDEELCRCPEAAHLIQAAVTGEKSQRAPGAKTEGPLVEITVMMVS